MSNTIQILGAKPHDENRLAKAAHLLALAERQRRRDGWLTADKVEELLLFDEQLEGLRLAWRSAIMSLKQHCADLSVLLADSPEYPTWLLRTAYAPALLFVRGSLSSSDEDAIAVVGSRKTNEAATRVAREVAAALASDGVTIVSGLARGVDTAAHYGALDVNGRTTAVVGTGIDVTFPPKNRELVEQIVQRGAVVSQFPPGLRPSKTSFPVRNAVIAGLASASLVIEAQEYSGTRITMDYTLQFNRPVLLWAPVVGKRPWARMLAESNNNVHLVGSTSEIYDLALRR